MINGKTGQFLLCPTSMNVCGHDAEVVSRFKLLGAILDSELNFIANIENTSKKFILVYTV
jgi:hypothetical protein